MVSFEHNSFEMCAVPGQLPYPDATGRPVLGYQKILDNCFLISVELCFLVTCIKVRSFVRSECMSEPFGGLSFNSFVQKLKCLQGLHRLINELR